MPMEDCLNNLPAQFDKPCPRTLKNSTPQDHTERKKDKSETQKSPENETSRPIKNASKISRPGQNFPRGTFFELL